MPSSREKRLQHLSLEMYRTGAGPPELREFIAGLLEGDQVRVASHIKGRGGSGSGRKRSGKQQKLKIDLHSPVLEGFLPLFLAAQGNTRNHARVVKHLIKRGAKPRDSRTGRTGLHQACECDSVEVTREWLKLFPTAVEDASLDGSTPLSIAAQCGSIECCQLLLRFGSDPNVRTVQQATALLLACGSGQARVVDVLLSNDRAQADARLPNSAGHTPLFAAAARGYAKIVELLLSKGGLGPSDVNLQVASSGGQTPLIAAARRGDIGILCMLIQAEADLDQPDASGRTPLYAASQEGHLDVVKHLLDSGAELEPHMEDGSSPLAIAAKRGHDACVLELINYGADVRRQDANGKTIFEVACTSGDPNVLRLLVKHGARGSRWRPAIWLQHQARRSKSYAGREGRELRRRHNERLRQVKLEVDSQRALIDDALKLCGEAEKAAGKVAETVDQIARLNRGQSISEDPTEGTADTKAK